MSRTLLQNFRLDDGTTILIEKVQEGGCDPSIIMEIDPEDYYSKQINIDRDNALTLATALLKLYPNIIEGIWPK